MTKTQNIAFSWYCAAFFIRDFSIGAPPWIPLFRKAGFLEKRKTGKVKLAGLNEAAPRKTRPSGCAP
ncbi:hypothetical protein GQE99_14110 [Maritimibacter sp. DP07]|uniref:Uncharacterized protein n=1 Tax=Maritimibacter harenae TaxID=2606218 RepID=A0A845M918_9RHOB|nr:hypothetical protein [Maritimibacter harenae]MZR14153.1 hypothetical protein [Maritimibacter harenae]